VTENINGSFNLTFNKNIVKCDIPFNR